MSQDVRQKTSQKKKKKKSRWEVPDRNPKTVFLLKYNRSHWCHDKNILREVRGQNISDKEGIKYMAPEMERFTSKNCLSERS